MRRPNIYLRPQLFVLPFASGVHEGIVLPSGGGWVIKIELLHLLRLDDYDAEVLPCHWIVQVLNLRAKLQVLVIIGLVRTLTWWRCSE